MNPGYQYPIYDGYNNQGLAPPVDFHSPPYVPQYPPQYAPQAPYAHPPGIPTQGDHRNQPVIHAPINVVIKGNENANINANPNPIHFNPFPVAAIPVQVVRYSDYLGLSIFTLLCCFLPIGIAAVLFSCKTRDSLMRNDLVSAKSDSHTTYVLNMVNIGVGLAFYAILIGLVIYYSTA